MAQKRIVTQKEAARRTVRKLSLDLDILPANDAERGRKQAEMVKAKAAAKPRPLANA